MFKSYTISRIVKGGETMKTLVLVLALMVVVVGACVADTVTYDVYGGWNLISCPLVPFNPDPAAVFAAAPQGIDGLLSRTDPSSGGITYDALDPTGFGNCLLGDGYWLQCFSGPTTLSYTGVPDGVPDGSGAMTDMWISLPGNSNTNSGGWHQIGHPFNHATPVDDGSGTGANVLFTDGTTLKTWSEAAAAAWVNDNMSGANASSGGFTVQFDGLGDDDHLRAGKGYWIYTYKPNLAMIILASATD